MNRYQAIIIGRGLAGLCAAARLTEMGVKKILVVGDGAGGTPYIAAVNFVLPDNPHGDTPHQYEKDMLDAGYQLGDRVLVRDMTQKSADGYALLRRFDIDFATEEGGDPKLRHLSGHTHPRSLCKTTGLIGVEMLKKLTEQLKVRGVEFANNRCVRLLSDGRRVYGATLLDRKHFNKLDNVYAPVVIAAWGGVGSLFSRTTYPGDVSGETLAMAYQAGAGLTDIEFVEYEPMVVLAPAGATGEPCPTAMLGEGAHLKNSLGERFLLSVRPQGEAGAPKSLINRMIWKEVEAGRGSPLGGVYVDLRHLSVEVLRDYPWFYNRLTQSGLDPKRELVEVGPMAHSFSGGVKVDREYRSTLEGLYAVGEACGGVHGACRCAGNAASQAVLSGLLCAQAVALSGETHLQWEKRFPCERRIELGVYLRYAPRIREIAARALAIYRTELVLQQALSEIRTILSEKPVHQDEDTRDLALSVQLMLMAALRRRESRGTHLRLDYPETNEAFLTKIILSPGQEEGV